MFNLTFKTNPYLELAIMTGITRVSRESIFSDLNNVKIVTTTSDEYANCLGFTEEEVFVALDECGILIQKAGSKKMVRWVYLWELYGYLQSLVDFELPGYGDAFGLLGQF